MSEIHFDLKKNPVKYSYEGQDTDGNFIILAEPSLKILPKLAYFKAAFMSASVKIPDSNEAEDTKEKNASEETDPNMIVNMLYAYHDDMEELITKAKALFTKTGVAAVEGVQNLTMPILETMHPRDFERMLGVYYVNFILELTSSTEKSD